MGMPVGVTANSFTSVSLDPPLLLVSLSRQMQSNPEGEEREGRLYGLGVSDMKGVVVAILLH
jgi:hypothetical protein